MMKLVFTGDSSAIVIILFRGRLVGVKLNNRRSRSMPRYMRRLEWESMQRGVRGIAFCRAAKAVAKAAGPLDTCVKMNMLRDDVGTKG